MPHFAVVFASALALSWLGRFGFLSHFQVLHAVGRYEAVAFAGYVGLPPEVADVCAVLHSATVEYPSVVYCDVLVAEIEYSHGFAAVGKKKFGTVGVYVGIVAVCFIRFLCHYITGVFIWGQWAPEGMAKALYSLLYNGQYMLPETILTLVAAVLLLRAKPIRKLMGLTK